MIKDSLVMRICVRSFAWVYSFAIPIISFIYYVFYVTQRKCLLVELLPDAFSIEFLNSSLSGFLHYWLGFELIFLLYFQVTKSRFQGHLPPITPSKQTRIELLKYCFCTIDKFDEWIEGWFNIGHNKSTVNQIYRDNFAEWLSWGFFAISLEMARNNPEYLKEINEIIDSIEKSKKIKFREGYNPNCKCIKLTLDPVEAVPRPFVFYAAIFLVTSAFNIILKFYGFEHFGSNESILNGYWSSTLEFDIQEGSPPSRISYWYYDPHFHHDSFSTKKSRQKPIVFIHGVGGGLFGYSNFIRKLWKLNRPLFLVELPYVSMQMVEDVPTMEETVREIEEMLISRNYSKAIFVAHSLGTAVCAWMFKEARKRIGGLVLIDPIIFLLHHPDVAYNFKYRIPRAANEHLMSFFASHELYSSYYFSRHFHWFQCILLITPRNVLPHNTYVYISENDNIVPSKEVYKYLSKHNVKAHMMRKLDHASFLFNTHWEDKIIADVLRCCNSKRS